MFSRLGAGVVNPGGRKTAKRARGVGRLPMRENTDSLHV